MRVLPVVLGLVVLLAGRAAADVQPYTVDGEADAGGADPRVAALDEAFARAVSLALGDVLGADARKAHKAVLDKEILGRARLWVAGFKVTKDQTVDGRRQLSVEVRVDRDKMRTRLDQLDIADAPDPSRPARTSVVLLRVTEGSTVRASFGANAEKDPPGMGAFAGSLRAAGLTIKRVNASGQPAKAAGDLPLEDDDAEGYLVETRSELAAVAGVTVGAPVPVRGVAGNAVLVTAHVRVLAKGKKLVGQGVASVASRGSDPAVVNAAIDGALVAATQDAIAAQQIKAIDKPQGFTGDDTPLVEPGVVLVRIPAKTPFALVAAELKYLSGARGVSAATLRRVSPGGWMIGVTTAESVQKIAAIARKAPTADTTVQVRVVGEVVEVAIGGR
jgi:hypothetical protein